MSKVTFTTYDRLNKRTSMTIPADDAVATADVQDVVDALDAVVLGTAASGSITVPEIVDAGTPGPSTDPDADRGRKWLFRTFVAAENKVFNNEIGTADNAQLPSAGVDFLDLTAGVGLAIKTAWEVVYLSPNGNAGVLASVQQVTREET